MSRIGKKPLLIPKDVTVEIRDRVLYVKGPKGELRRVIHPHVTMVLGENDEQPALLTTVNDPEDKKDRSLWGLYGRLAENMIRGVTDGYSKQLEITGIGYKVNLSGKKLVLEVGFSHSVEFELPVGIEALVEKNTITIRGIDKELVGDTAARIRSIRKPEPYKGKGIKYVGEVVRRKAGKTAKTTAA